MLAQVIRNDGGTGEFTTVVLGTSAYEAALLRPRRLHRAVRGLGGHRGRAARAAAEDVPLHRLRLPGRLQRRAHRQRALAGRASRPGHGVRQAAAAGYQFAADDPDRGRAAAHRRQPGRVHRGELVRRASEMLSDRYLRDEPGGSARRRSSSGRATPVSLSRTGLLTGPDGAPLASRPDFGDLVQQRLPGQTLRWPARRPEPGRWWRPVPAPVRIGRATRIPRRRRGTRGAPGCAGCSPGSGWRCSWSRSGWRPGSGTWSRSAVRPQVLPSPVRVLEQGWAFRDAALGQHRAHAPGHRGRVRGVAGSGLGAGGARWTSRRGCAAPSSRCWSPRRPCRSSPSPR